MRGRSEGFSVLIGPKDAKNPNLSTTIIDPVNDKIAFDDPFPRAFMSTGRPTSRRELEFGQRSTDPCDLQPGLQAAAGLAEPAPQGQQVDPRAGGEGNGVALHLFYGGVFEILASSPFVEPLKRRLARNVTACGKVRIRLGQPRPLPFQPHVALARCLDGWIWEKAGRGLGHGVRLAQSSTGFTPPLLTLAAIRPICPPVRRPGGRGGGYAPVEESPGSTVKRRRVTPARGDPRDSATESKPPALRGREG